MKKLIVALVLIIGCVRQAPPQPKITHDTFIEISLGGGGIYGGINPTIQNASMIKSNGEISIIHRALYTGAQKDSKRISRAQLEGLAKFIAERGFFKMKDVYDCREGDKKCQLRKTGYPPAVPLSISIAIGDLRKTVTVTVYEKGMVDYPEDLEVIVNKINEAISQALE